MAEVYEYEAPWLQLGQQAEMSLAYQPGKTYHGKIVYVYPYLMNKTRTIQVRMEFPNTADFELKPEMWSNVVVHSTIVHDGLAIPIQAVLRTGKRDIALIALGEGRFAPRDLRLGAQAGDEFQVLDGLKEGERVVTSAQFLINSESNLRSAIGKMLGHGAGEESPGMKNKEGAQQPKTSQPAGKMDMPGMKSMEGQQPKTSEPSHERQGKE
jgi:multidrug efflux pump subunit AcrA (membrane-fusion protein)